MRRPATGQMTRDTFSFLCISVGNRGGADDTAAKIATLSNLVQAHAPTFIILNEVTSGLYAQLKESAAVRAGYGVTEFSPNSCNMLVAGAAKQVDHTSCLLVAHYVPLPFVEHNIKCEFNSEYKTRPFAIMYIRGFLGRQFAIGALHFDPLNIVATRATAISKCLEIVDPAESPVALFFANYLEAVSGSIRADVPTVLEKNPNFHWTDVQKLQQDACDVPVGRESSALWMRQSNANPVVVQSSSVLKAEDFTFSSLTVFRAGSGQSPGSGIAIPQPRSAKDGKASPSVPPTPMNIDPAVVSIDRSPNTLPQSNAQQRPSFPMQPSRPSRRWSADRSTHIRRPPDHDERDYDLGQFKTVDEAIRSLNGTFQWNFDYMIIGSNLLYCDGAKPSYPAFKRYCSEHLSQMTQWRKDNNLPTGKAARLAAQRQPSAPLDVGNDDMHSGAANSTPPPAQIAQKHDVLALSAPSIPPSLAHVGHTAPSAASPQPIAASTPNVPKQQTFIPRQRVWSEHCATILYQTTPLEMRFDISSFVGQAKNNLSVAIERLNSRKKVDAGGKPDPLGIYAFDYALLFNPERQAYWLLSCTDVPCDIVACRNTAFRLSN